MPDFRMQQNSFPISSVIDAATRNAQLQVQARDQGNKALIEGLQAIGGIGQSLYDQKVKVAQALAGAHLYAQEHPEVVGDNQVTSTPQGPVTQNQTAAYDPATGSVTPSRPPLDIRTIATAMQGMSPKDMFENQVQSRLAKVNEGELGIKKQYEPEKIANESKRIAAEEENNRIQRLIQGMLANATIKNQQAQREQESENAALDANKEAAKHYLLHPVDAYRASKALSSAGKGQKSSGGWSYVGKVEKK
jgi:hypothetical protein